MGTAAVGTKQLPTRDKLIEQIKDKHAEMAILLKDLEKANSQIKNGEYSIELIDNSTKLGLEIQNTTKQILETTQKLIKVSGTPKIAIKQASKQIQIFFEYQILPFEPKSIGNNRVQAFVEGDLRDDLMKSVYETNLFPHIDVRGNLMILHYETTSETAEFLTQEAKASIRTVMTSHGFATPEFNNID